MDIPFLISIKNGKYSKNATTTMKLQSEVFWEWYWKPKNRDSREKQITKSPPSIKVLLPILSTKSKENRIETVPIRLIRNPKEDYKAGNRPAISSFPYMPMMLIPTSCMRRWRANARSKAVQLLSGYYFWPYSRLGLSQLRSFNFSW